MADCPDKPPCPSGTPTWACGKRAEIERAMFHLDITRSDGERLLRAMKLPMRVQSATERYNRQQRDKQREGPLFA